MDIINLAIKFSDKLGWGNMPVHIALPAIQEIINTSPIDPEELLTCDSDDIFGIFAGKEVTHEDYLKFISLRWEIEECMRNGMSHIDALSEWWK